GPHDRTGGAVLQRADLGDDALSVDPVMRGGVPAGQAAQPTRGRRVGPDDDRDAAVRAGRGRIPPARMSTPGSRYRRGGTPRDQAGCACDDGDLDAPTALPSTPCVPTHVLTPLPRLPGWRRLPSRGETRATARTDVGIGALALGPNDVVSRRMD